MSGMEHSSEIAPYLYSHLIFDQGTKAIQWRKESLFTKWCWNYWVATKGEKKTHLNSYLTQYVKNNLRWIIEVNVKVETKMPFRETQENVCVFE